MYHTSQVCYKFYQHSVYVRQLVARVDKASCINLVQVCEDDTPRS